METHRSIRGHELTIVERLRLEGDRVIYKVEVAAPGGNREEREIVFKVSDE